MSTTVLRYNQHKSPKKQKSQDTKKVGFPFFPLYLTFSFAFPQTLDFVASQFENLPLIDESGNTAIVILTHMLQSQAVLLQGQLQAEKTNGSCNSISVLCCLFTQHFLCIKVGRSVFTSSVWVFRREVHWEELKKSLENVCVSQSYDHSAEV